MAQINFLTPSGSIGTVTEKEYFEFQFDAYDSSGGIVNFVIVAGQLAQGFILSSSGLLYGVPVMNLNPITQQSFTQTFAIRAYRASDNTVLTDRTFNITLNPVALPQIYPLNTVLGTYGDGTYIDLQLLEYDLNPLTPPVTWTVVAGELPLGTILTSTGRLYGYILPTVINVSSSLIGWDLAQWDTNAWDLITPEAELKNYIFTVQIFDGSRYDKTTFSIVVTSTIVYSIDNTQITIDGTISIDHGVVFSPYISTPPQALPVQRELSNFAFQVVGVDLDGDVLLYNANTPASFGTNFSASLTEPLYPIINDQWWDLTNNQILVYATPTVATKAGEFTVGSRYIITTAGNGASITSFTATPTVTPTTVIGLITGFYSLTASINGGANQTANIVVTNTDTMSNIAGNLQTALSGVTVTASANDLIITSNLNSTNSSVVVTIPSTSGTDLIGAIDTKLNGAITTLSVPATNFNSCAALGSWVGTPNIVGSSFIASGAGTGSGYASLIAWSVLIPSSSLTMVDTNIPILQSVPPNLNLVTPTNGWITGTIANLSLTQQQTYVFQVQCHKQISPTFVSTPVTYVLTVLGSEVNSITWVTPPLVGTINGGSISELFLQATSYERYSLTYELLSGSLPLGLTLSPTGIIYGQVGYVNTTFDNNTTTFDNNTTQFATSTFQFKAQVTDSMNNYSIRTFTINVTTSNKPYENLYMKALMSKNQRIEFNSIIDNLEIFPEELLYRKDDPWFGKSNDIKFLLAAGLNVETTQTYINNMQNNQFNKNINIGNVKTAVALNADFSIRYEVVYLEVSDPQQVGQLTPSMSITSTTPPYDILFSNNLNNMKKEVVSGIGYSDRGALPAWMLSVQPNGLVLGFTYGIVLAYTVPGASSLIAYRLQQNKVLFNDLSFIIDRYQLNQVTGAYSLPEVGDVYLKFPKINSFGGEIPENYN